MQRISLVFLLAVVWVFLTGNFSLFTIIEGIVVSFLIVLLYEGIAGKTKVFQKLPKTIYFVIYFLYELLRANLRVAYDIITPKHLMSPGIVAIPLDAKTELEITLLANLITLTPGTLSLDVSEDKKVLFIHTMYMSDKESVISEIKNGLEKKLLEVMR